MMRPVIFDTDIGTDVDDILALVILAKAPELKLLGVYDRIWGHPFSSEDCFSHFAEA